MRSPFTGKEMTINVETYAATFRKETFDVYFHTYFCEDTNRKFEDEIFADLNSNQLYNQYREKHSIPFPSEIKAIREQYGVSAAMMSNILGFGANMYANYEIGEMPSLSNATVIDLVRNPQNFKGLVEKATIKETERKKILSKIEAVKSELDTTQKLLEKLELSTKPIVLNGYSVPKIEKLNALVSFFAHKMQPYKTALNKFLFYADFLNFQQTGFSITGLSYKAFPYGTVPINYEGIFREIEKENTDLEIKRTLNAEGTATTEQFTTKVSPKIDLFSVQELTVINKVIEKFEGMTVQEIVAINHKEKAWLENEMHRKVISYQDAFALNPF
jgi:DNA-binding transcriptional regulator YiaG